MKKIIFLLATLLLTACYDDQNGNDFDTVMDDMSIVIPETAYSGSLGGNIKITPVVKTNIPDSDLEYTWEALGSYTNERGVTQYYPFAEGKELDFTCALNACMTDLNTSYRCRLHAHQKSTNRDFYSSDAFTITIAGITGLMVLHGDDNSSDLGVLMAEEFTPAANSLPASPSALPHIYSQQNDGKTLQGKGLHVVQSIVGTGGSGNLNSTQKERCRIFIQTDKETAWANMGDFSYYGDWQSMFFLKGAKQANAGKPLGYTTAGTLAMAFDGGDIFVMRQSYQYPFLFATHTAETPTGNGQTMQYTPNLATRQIANATRMTGYAYNINGKNQKGFFSMIDPANSASWTFLFDTKNDIVKFNPGDMKADVVTMQYDNRYHVMAVMRGDADHPTFANKLFAVDVYPEAPSDGQESGYGGVPQFIYDLGTQPDINNAQWFDFGDSQNMCYYATTDKLYHYALDGNDMATAQELVMTDGSAFRFDGKITLMKLLRSPNVTTHLSEPVLILATYDGGKACLYALRIDTMTGNILQVAKYDGTTVDGWDFGIIRDVNIKGL